MSEWTEALDVFFNGRGASRAKGFQYLTVEERPSCTDNQHPNCVSPLFELWTKNGWEVVSVTVLPATSNIHMCKAIGVLRKADNRT